MERYSKIKQIGSGTFGQAWLVESTASKRKYALKELSVSAMSEQDRHLALNEAKILSKLKHKNIVRYKEAFVAQGKLCIAMEFAERGKPDKLSLKFDFEVFRKKRCSAALYKNCCLVKHIFFSAIFNLVN